MKQKILHVLSSNHLWGAERVAIDIIKNLNSEYEFAYASPEGKIKQALSKNNIRYFPLKKMNPFEIQRIIREYKPSLIHAHDFRASFFSAVTLFRGPIISHIHNNNDWARSINSKTLLYSLVKNRFKKIIVVSDSVIKEFAFRSYIQDKAIIVPNIVDTMRIQNEKVTKKVPSSDLLFVGRLTDQKNPLRFIHIVSQLFTTFPKIKALVIGDGSLRQDCENEIVRLGMSDRIQVLGYMENPIPYMASTKILVMPSRWEGFGLVAREAMLLGKPVVASPVGGLIHLVVDHKNGFLCDNDTEFVEKIKLLLLNNVLRKKLGESAKKGANEMNNTNEFLDVFRRIYAV